MRTLIAVTTTLLTPWCVVRTVRHVTHAEVVGARLRQARGTRSGAEIGGALGVTAQTVYRYESGAITVPPDRYHAIATVLGVPWSELFDPTPVAVAS